MGCGPSLAQSSSSRESRTVEAPNQPAGSSAAAHALLTGSVCIKGRTPYTPFPFSCSTIPTAAIEESGGRREVKNDRRRGWLRSVGVVGGLIRSGRVVLPSIGGVACPIYGQGVDHISAKFLDVVRAPPWGRTALRPSFSS
jgi:hypothetical protein